eukprot:7160851-Ditylum_brightwellii.AAC.1
MMVEKIPDYLLDINQWLQRQKTSSYKCNDGGNTIISALWNKAYSTANEAVTQITSLVSWIANALDEFAILISLV